MDIIDKFYLVCELFDDDLTSVIVAVKLSGCKIRPSRMMDDFEDYTEEKLNKYTMQFDYILVNNGGK